MCTATQSGFSRGERLLAIDWQDCGWCPVITVQMPRAGAAQRSNGARASARFDLRRNGMLQCPVRFRFVHRSGVNAARRVPAGSLPADAGLNHTARIFPTVPFLTP